MPSDTPIPPWITSRPFAWLVSAPGRVNLIGEHVDYCDGLVMPAGIGLRTWMTGEPRTDGLICVETEEGLRAIFPATGSPAPGPDKWENYLRGVLAGCLAAGLQPPGVNVRVSSTLPRGGGLASSAAFTVAFAGLLEKAAGVSLGGARKALICQEAEAFAGVPSGCMDMMASIHAREGHAMLIDCRDRSVEQVFLGEVPPDIMIIDTGVKHDLADGGYTKRYEETREAARLLGVASLRDYAPDRLHEAGDLLPPVLFRRVRHVVTEIARTRDFARAVRGGEWTQAGELMRASHESLRVDYEVSCPELDLVAAHAWTLPGVLGCRMTGGGFGGSCVALVKLDAAVEVREELESLCRNHLGASAGVRVTAAGGGARG